MARDVCDFFTGSKHDLLYGYNIPVDVETFFDEGTKKCWLAHNFLNEAIDGELNNFYNSRMFYLPLVQSLKFLGRIQILLMIQVCLCRMLEGNK